MQTALVFGVVTVLAGATSSPDPTVRPAVRLGVGPAAPDQKPPPRDRFGNLKPVCTLRVLPADPRIDPEFARPVEGKIDPEMVVPSGCRQ